jgi:hypothetical protein
MNRWKNHFCLLLHVRDLNGVTHTNIHTAEPLVPKAKAFEVQNANKSNRHKSSSTYQLPAELIQTEARAVCSNIHKHIHSIWNKKWLTSETTVLQHLYTRMVIEITLCNIKGYHCCKLHSKSLLFHRASPNNRHKVRPMHLIQVAVRIKLTATQNTSRFKTLKYTPCFGPRSVHHQGVTICS